MCIHSPTSNPVARRSRTGDYLFAKFWARAHRGFEAKSATLKQELFSGIGGTAVEIGPGTGSNFRYFQPGTRIIGVEPNPFMHPYMAVEAEKHGHRLEAMTTGAESLALDDNSVDAVVCTLVLCSVHDTARVLRETRRVLKPGGAFYFIEHVAAPRGTLMRQMQEVIVPVWRRMGNGCHPNRETWRDLEGASFSSLRLERERISTPFVFVTQLIYGVARK